MTKVQEDLDELVELITNMVVMKVGYGLGAIIVLGVVIGLLLTSIVIINQTEKGVLLSFGKYSGELEPGLSFIIPIKDKVVRYKITQQTLDFTENKSLEVLTADGLYSHIDISIIYRVSDPGLIYQNIGENYNPWLIAKVRGVSRDVFSAYTTEELYTALSREQISANIKDKLQDSVGKYFIIEDVKIRKIQLPARIREAINEKIEAMQRAEKMKFEIQKEELEAKRKIVEAEGIKNSTEIIAKGINEDYLKWKYMEVLSEFAKSENNAIIIVPVSADNYVGINSSNMDLSSLNYFIDTQK